MTAILTLILAISFATVLLSLMLGVVRLMPKRKRLPAIVKAGNKKWKSHELEYWRY